MHHFSLCMNQNYMHLFWVSKMLISEILLFLCLKLNFCNCTYKLFPVSQCFVPSMFLIVSGLIFPLFLIFRAQIYFLFVGVCLLFAERSAAFVLCLPLLPEQLMHNQSTSPAGCAVASLPRTPTLYGRISPLPPAAVPQGVLLDAPMAGGCRCVHYTGAVC